MLDRKRLVRFLAEKSYQEGDLDLSSGISTKEYVDAKKVTYHPDCVELIGEGVLAAIKGFNVGGIGGLTMGADAIVVSTVWAAKARGLSLPGLIVRKRPKAHGLQQQIEGAEIPKGTRVAIVDDVVTSGGSVIKAIDLATKEGGLEVAVVVALVDREQGGKEAIEALGIPFRSLCTLAEIRQARDTSLTSAN